ncbi:M1 family metallopeptidase [Aeromicrobium sp. Leaf350]|uniref:M1 family metallopeptidase n=1 Tax=Aeromicrobium sp. Leaf350 TaxID=2876565 RepID=UPI001E3C9381|nr:M1 family metallopeptidase [Aeromicrobium sp. Leaf350]
MRGPLSRLRGPRGNDVYVPHHGDPTFRVRHYDLDLTIVLVTNSLSGVATLSCHALEDLDDFALDLYRLRVSKIKVDGAAPAKFTQRQHRLVVRPRRTIPAGTDFTVQVAYHGSPQPMPGPDGEAGWEELADGLIVASQPHGAPSWYPCNDRPDDKATYGFEITVPQGYTAVANGRAGQTRRRGSTVRWSYTESSPMASYLATVQVGRYVALTGKAAGVELTTWCPPGRKSQVADAFGDQPAMVEAFSRLFGPYPFDTYAAVVTDDELEIPLEAHSLSIFGSNLADRDWAAQRLIAHELAHQWFGNSVTLQHWRDIWLHEGFACYAEWLWSEESGGLTADAQAQEHHDLLSGLRQDLVLSDPGPDDMFDDRVYKRGALMLHALRLRLGDEAFFELLRTWSERFRHANVTTDDFVDLVAETTGVDGADFFGAWLDHTALPPLT